MVYDVWWIFRKLFITWKERKYFEQNIIAEDFLYIKFQKKIE